MTGEIEVDDAGECIALEHHVVAKQVGMHDSLWKIRIQRLLAQL